MGTSDWKTLERKYYATGIIFDRIYFQNHILLSFRPQVEEKN